MGKVLSRLEDDGLFLEVGIGNGGNTKLVKDKFDMIVGTDLVDLHQVKNENPFAELIMADRATCFRSSIFDVVAFNPPYVPSETIMDRSVDGGPNGVEIPLEFLGSALEVTKKTGRILILLSSDDKVSQFQDFCFEHNLVTKKLAEKRLFFESLVIYELKFDSQR